MDLDRALKMGVGAAGALAEIHRHGSVHQDIRPRNLRMDPELGCVEVLSPTVERPEDPYGPGAILLERLPYIAPEQTGRMNRPVDHRADLYSLGITLYEMISGALPFKADDPIGWMHCHIAKSPRPLTTAAPGVPPIVGEILMKLLAKVADERYQSAHGLRHDLQRCLAELEASGQIAPFPLGSRDIPERLQIPAKLYGREKEVAALSAGFERVVHTGEPELLLIAGYSGIGKSALVQEIQRPIARERGFFVAGKFEEQKRDVPYSMLGRALREIVRQVLTESDARLAVRKQALSEALGSNGGLIAELVPEVEILLGAQPAARLLSASNTQDRMNLALQRFIGVFARREHPLVLFLDDLQWADLGTLRVLRYVLEHPDTRHLLVIGAYRDNEVSPSHPLVAMLEELGKGGARLTTVTLGPLPEGHLGELAADALRCERARVEPLAALLIEKTGGNPFFVTQFLTELHREGLLRLDPDDRSWRWDLTEIRAKRFTDNIVDLMLGKLRRLPEPTQEALRLAACIGHEFDLALLAVLHGKTAEEARAALAPATREGLLLGRGDAYRFLHDRVQQAALALVPEEEQGRMRLEVGRLLLAHTKEGSLDDRLFEICHHVGFGAGLIDAPDERRRFAELHLRAGKRAKASAAYRSAAAYLATGAALLGDGAWDAQRELAYALRFELAESHFLAGRFDEVERLCAELLPSDLSPIERASVYRLRIQLATARVENKKAIELAAECLALFGIPLPLSPSEAEVVVEIQRLLEARRGRPMEELLEARPIQDPAMSAVMAVLAAVYLAALYTQPNVTDLLVCHMVRISMSHGLSPDSAAGYASFGVALCTRLGAYQDGYLFGKLAYDLTDRHGLIAAKAEVCTRFASMISVWTRHVSTNIEYCTIGFEAALEAGNITYACIHRAQTLMSMVFKGDPLEEVYGYSLRVVDFLTKTKFRAVLSTITSIQRFVLNMQERTAHFSTFSGDGFDEAAFEAELEPAIAQRKFYYYLLKLEARFISGDYREAMQAADTARGHLWSHAALMTSPQYHFFAALAAAAIAEGRAEGEQRTELCSRLHAHVEKLKLWAESCPANYLGKHALVAAEIARIEGRHGEAAGGYEAAARAFAESGFLHEQALCFELAGRFYLDRDLASMATACLREARSCYERWGAHGKVRQLDRIYPWLVEPERQARPRALATSAELLNTAAIVRASQALSREIAFDRLVATLMRLVIEHAGARRSCLLLPRGEELTIAADIDVEDPAASLRALEAGSGVQPVRPTEDQVSEVAALPWSIVNFVRRTAEGVILDDAAATAPHASDEYIASVRPRSLLCVPVQLHGARVGILYLENKLTVGAFSPNHLAIAEFLAAQAAISLENSRLYEELARENTERKEIEATLRQSEERLRAQLQITVRQEEAIQRLSTPIIEVWEGVLMMPIIGLVDSTRTQQMMDALLSAVARTRSRYAMIDLTGVDVVDTHTADHIVRLALAVRLLGAQGIVVGIRPNVAQTMASMGVGLSDLVTLASVREALLFCIRSKTTQAR